MDIHRLIQLSDGKYVAPTTGWYVVKTEIINHIPTGECETVPNPDKQWWEFWKEDYVTRQIYKTEKAWTGSGMQLLVEGEIVDFRIVYKL
jgi:hypothetical protein